jgi:hypothetical protein
MTFEEHFSCGSFLDSNDGLHQVSKLEDRVFEPRVTYLEWVPEPPRSLLQQSG